MVAPPAVTSSPRPSRRVTDRVVAPPPPEAEIDDQTREQTAPDAASQNPAKPEPATAPEESSDRIVTEADRPAAAALAPRASSRPANRPKRPKPAAPKPDNKAAIQAALDAVRSEQGSDAPQALAGPPLTGGEKDAFLLDVRRCWTVGALSTEAMQSKVVVRFELGRDGKPDIGSIRMTGFEGGTQAGAKRAYETARRAIIRCGASGYNLPIEKYEQWKIVNITFNPENMRLK
ncbi:MAG: hypothetical protein CSA68_02080 [Rhodobacterales bacterium]|nr:MAG: hypothetical protein CSA68_02080 [Rhodobacterales bacterium]